MRQIMSIVSWCLICGVLSGCTSVPTSSKQFALEITSEPSGAEIWTHYRPERGRNYLVYASRSAGLYNSSPMLVGKTPYRAELCFYRGGGGFYDRGTYANVKPPWNNMNDVKGGAAFNVMPWLWLTSTNTLAPALFASSESHVSIYPVMRDALTLDLDFTLRAEGCEESPVCETISTGSCTGLGGTVFKLTWRCEGNVPAVVRRNYILKQQGQPSTQQAGSAPAKRQGNGDVAERLRKLKELHDQGLLSDGDYETRKKTMLDEL